MQNAALQYLGLDLIYIAVPCKDEDLELVLNSFKKINCKGLNITIPHKEKVFNLCSEISPIACLLYTSPSPRDPKTSRMPSSA